MFWWLRRIGSGVGSFLCIQAVFDADWSVPRVIRSARPMASLLLPSFPSFSSLMDPNTLFKNQRVLWSFCNCLFLTVYHASFFLFEGFINSCWPQECGRLCVTQLHPSVQTSAPVHSFIMTSASTSLVLRPLWTSWSFNSKAQGWFSNPDWPCLLSSTWSGCYLLSPAMGSWPRIASVICFWCAHLDYDGDR